MTLPRRTYPVGAAAPPMALHVERPGVPPVDEQRQGEGLVNPVDGGTDLRVTLAPGSSPSSAAALAALLAEVAARGIDAADQLRAAKSAIGDLLYELQHPKQELYRSTADVVVGIGATVALTPWIDTRLWRWIGYYVANVGQNTLAALVVEWSEDLAGAGPFATAQTTALALGAGTCVYSQSDVPAAGVWAPGNTAPLAARYLRLSATGGIDASAARACVKGMR